MWEGGDICVLMADPPCCMAETDTPLKAIILQFKNTFLKMVTSLKKNKKTPCFQECLMQEAQVCPLVREWHSPKKKERGGRFYSSFPGGSEVKASASTVGDLGSIPGSGRSPGEGNGNPLQYSCLENPMDGGAW